MYFCMGECEFLFLHVRELIFIDMFVCVVCICMIESVYLRAFLHVCVFECVFVCVSACVCVYVCMCKCVCVCVS